MQKQEIIDEILTFLNNEMYRYEYIKDDAIIRMRFGLKSAAVRSVDVIWDIKDDGYLVYTYSPISASENAYDEMCRYLSAANYGSINGNFEIDKRDGEIRHKCYQNMSGINNLSKEVLQESLEIGMSAMRTYGKGIMAIAIGATTADKAIEEAEKGMTWGNTEDSDDE